MTAHEVGDWINNALGVTLVISAWTLLVLFIRDKLKGR